ncbi:AraC family transcriptional regulator [Pedobacter steynii]|nr:helix-turn-helix domain-containing protein [Pedobacter steynii]NQX43191.1 AraC family transcriptional regulator [Pedobacter steynii]
MTLSLFFASISCFFLLLFSLHLFCAKRGIRLLNYLLALLFFSKFGQVLIALLMYSDQKAIYPAIYQLFTPLSYIAPACFYLYTTNFIPGNQQLSKGQWLHFIPVVFAFAHLFSDVPINWTLIANQIAENGQLFSTERTGLFPAVFFILVKPGLVIIYLALTWYAVLKSKVLDKNAKHPGRNWLLLFLKGGTFFQLTGFLPLVFQNLNLNLNMNLPDRHASFLLLNSIAFLMIITYVLNHPRLFYGYLFVSVNLDMGQTDIGKEIRREVPTVTNTIKKVSLLPDQLINYSNAMKEVMETKKPYLLESFQIVDLAGALNIPVHHCSFVLNNLIGKNFRDWINEYRINSFLEQYPLKAQRMTIESIAHECGFKSVATFYNAFKKETGIMPTVYFSQKKVS